MMQVQGGDEGALGQLFDRHAQTVLGIGMRVLRDPGEAQELVQDVFLQVYQKRHLFDPEKGTARAWLLQTAYHKAFDRREYLQFRRFYENQNLEDYSESCGRLPMWNTKRSLRNAKASCAKPLKI